MRGKLLFFKACLLLLLCVGSISAQTDAGTFDKDGLKFNYPADWQLTDQTTSEKQLLLLSKKGLTVLIAIDSPRISMRERGYSRAQSQTNTLYITNIENILDMARHPTTKEFVCMDFNGTDAPGIRYTGSQKNEPTKGETYTFTVGGKSLSLLHSDR